MKKQPEALYKPEDSTYHLLFGPSCSANPTPYSGLLWTLISSIFFSHLLLLEWGLQSKSITPLVFMVVSSSLLLFFGCRNHGKGEDRLRSVFLRHFRDQSV